MDKVMFLLFKSTNDFLDKFKQIKNFGKLSGI